MVPAMRTFRIGWILAFHRWDCFPAHLPLALLIMPTERWRFFAFSPLLMASGETHPSRSVPPNAAWISPTGTSRAFCSSSPKPYPTAENSATASGVVFCHFASGTSSCGSASDILPVEYMRRPSVLPALAFASLLMSMVWSTFHAMFDCPLHSHTSPMSTSSRTISDFPSDTVIVYG